MFELYKCVYVKESVTVASYLFPLAGRVVHTKVRVLCPVWLARSLVHLCQLCYGQQIYFTAERTRIKSFERLLHAKHSEPEPQPKTENQK